MELGALVTALFLAAGDGRPPAEIALADALLELDRQNLTLAQARGRADEAVAVAAQARAQLAPSLSAQGQYLRNSDSVDLSGLLAALQLPAGAAASAPTIQPLAVLSVSGSIRVPLIVPSTWFEVSAATGGARAARASAEAARLQVRSGFAQAAFAARAAEEVVVASERAVESAAELARSADRRVAAGTAAPLDALKARTEQVRRESDLAQARAALDRARLALGVVLGREAPVRVAVPDLGDGDAASPEADAADALGRRPEIAAQLAHVDAARQQVRASWARLVPQLSASASVFTQDVPLATNKREGWRASLDLVWPIFDGGLREGRRGQAEAQLATARAAAEAQRLAVIQEVADGSRDLSVARERLRLADTQRRLASDAAASARRSFEAGVASSLDVIDANDRLYLADIGLADARARLAQARIALDRALGRDIGET